VWVYIKTDPGCYTVGFYSPDQWHTDSDHSTKEEAAQRCHYLNGGNMTLREWYAGMALQGLLAAKPPPVFPREFAPTVVAWADALLDALEGKEGVE
jgi:hypothetical protein